MRWLMRRLRGNDPSRGAVAVIVAIVFGGGVMLGMGAFVVDVGGMYAEASQLQNGADAAALAVAQGCARGTTTCSGSTAAGGLAGTYANRNANDGKTTVNVVCGNDGLGGTYLNPCASGMTACPSAAPSTPYAQVQVSTLQSNGSTVLPPTFGKAVMGSSWSGEHVIECAQATWGAPGSLGNAVAVTISNCEWQNDTGNGTSFARPGPWPTWPPAYTSLNVAGSEQVLVLHGDSGSTSCNAGNDSAGWDAPGAFGWVGTGSVCSVSITNNTYPATPGNNAITACASVFNNALNTHTPVYIPIYSGTSGTGSNVQYTLQGFAAFVITGWNVVSGNSGWKQTGVTDNQSSIISGKDYCKKPTVASNSDVCLYGFFTQTLIPASALPSGSGSNLGVTSVKLSG